MSRLLLLLAFAAALAGCSRDGDKGVAPPRVEKDTVIFDASSPQIAALQTASAEPRRDSLARFSGRLVWNEDRTVRVFSPFAGRVVSIAARVADSDSPSKAITRLGSDDGLR